MTMVEKLQKVSDRTGDRLTEDNSVTIAIRKHPDIAESVSKRLEITTSELVDLPGWRDAVHLEIHLPGDRQPLHISCSAEAFDKFLHPEKVDELSSLRGRQKGMRPGLEVI
jgi:hypothetical protein